MLVYGRQEYRTSLGTMLEHLCRLAGRTCPDDVDQLRTLAIQAGQLEQGVEDYNQERNRFTPDLLNAFRNVTERLAEEFYHCWAGSERRHGTAHAGMFGALVREAARLNLTETLLTIRIPEGFEYYGLFPEQYCASALRWAQNHSDPQCQGLAVVGVRSIGTTLAAMVKAVLAQKGWEVLRLTVRPRGDPFNREVRLPCFEIQRVSQALVVDEGPGLSGSSMASVARALLTAGVKAVSFLPGHAGSPGGAASAEIQRCWAETPRYVTSLQELKWNGRCLTEALAVRTKELRFPASNPMSSAGPNSAQTKTCEDLSTGQWRSHAFLNSADSPVSCDRFERMKFLCRCENGSAVLWKFTGLGCVWSEGKTSEELALDRIGSRVRARLVPEPVCSFRGFTAVPWLDGRRLYTEDAHTPGILTRLGEYVACASGPPLPTDEAASSWQRLTEMLYANSKESLGQNCAERTRVFADAGFCVQTGPTYGDGRMAPYEWIQTASGEVFKTDCTGHELDHTLIGKQSVLWDVAGTVVEWNLNPEQASLVIAAATAVAPMPVQQQLLKFYTMAYASFRMGITSFCADQLPSGVERDRLQSASRFYRLKLEESLR